MKLITTSLLFVITQSLFGQLTGCTDPLASNFNANATQNDGSCVYLSATLNPLFIGNVPVSVSETSGLLYFNHSLLTHNDDTDTKLYQLDLSNNLTVQTHAIGSVTNKDWEDISEDQQYIYIGDFGNNVSGNRTDLRIYRIAKDVLANDPQVDTIQFNYSLQTDFAALPSNTTNFDCEAFIVTSNFIYLFTKEWGTQKTSLYRLSKDPGTHTATFLATLNVGGLITGATNLDAERIVVLSGYSTALSPFVYLLYDYENENFFDGNKRKMGVNLPFHQVEAITAKSATEFYISNEAVSIGNLNVPAKIHQIDLSSYLNSYLNTSQVYLETIENAIPLLVDTNPVKSVLLLNEVIVNKDNTIILYNSCGITLKREKVNGKHLDISLLKDGFYFLEVMDQFGQVVGCQKVQIIN